METSFDLMLWRATLATAGPVPDERELDEWAQLLADAGTVDEAALLREVAGLYRGSSQADAVPSPDPGREGWTLHRALDELCMLAREIAPLGLPGLIPPAPPAFSGRPDNPAGIGAGSPAPPAPDDIANIAYRLRAALETAPGEGAPVLEALTGQLVEADRRLPAFDYRTVAQAPLALLVPAIATAGLIDWALVVRDLTCAPLGSPALLHRAARLDPAGLGPYFRNVGRLVRNAADLFDLARLAAEAGGGQAATEAWIVLLSRGCRGALLLEIVDELGDRDAGTALAGILDRIASRPAAAIDLYLVFRIRDAALDNADYPLAARAQRTVVRLRPHSRLEGVILGEIEASGGEFGRAEAIFRHWLDRSPGDEHLRTLLVAVRLGRFDAFRLERGFGSPLDRQEARLRRRGVPPVYPRRRGERIEAVDVR